MFKRITAKLDQAITWSRLITTCAITMAFMLVMLVNCYTVLLQERGKTAELRRQLNVENAKLEHAQKQINALSKRGTTQRSTKAVHRATLLDENGRILKVDIQEVPVKVNTLAIRNKNPLNVKTPHSGKWRGQIGTDKIGHAIFDTWESGIRAAAYTLKNYEARHGICTVDAIVSRFCEAEGKAKQKYVDYICRRMGLQPLETFSIRKRLPELLKVMTRYESGQTFPERFYLPYDIVTTIS